MRVVRRADVHCVHIRTTDQVVVIRKPALRGDAVFLADRIQLFPVNIADGHKLQIRALAYAGSCTPDQMPPTPTEPIRMT